MGGRFISLLTAFAMATAVAGSASAMTDMSPTRSTAPARQAPAVVSVPASLPSDRVLGRADAPITIIEYASFTCSHCADFANTVLPELKARYIDTGKAKLIFRDLPTPPLQVANAAAALGRCAAPSKFFDMASQLMANQASAFASGAVQNWLYSAIGTTGRTEQELQTCMRLPATAEGLARDTSAALAAGVDSTPSLFVNGRRVEDHSLQGMVAAIQPLVR